MKVQWVSCGSVLLCITAARVLTSHGKLDVMLLGTVISSVGFICRLFEDFMSQFSILLI